jgi:hypothetical protein
VRLGIVGSEQAKFTPEIEAAAREAIRDAIKRHGATTVVSGGCHLGGVDIFAEEEAKALGLDVVVYKPATLQWSGGYKERNLLIANGSDHCICITVKELPPTYRGMTFKGCYHCLSRTPPHVKSGGCWTAWRCKSREWIII